MANTNKPVDNPQRKYRLILKDTDNRAVMVDVSGYPSIGTGAYEKKLIKAYEKLLVDEEKYQEENA